MEYKHTKTGWAFTTVELTQGMAETFDRLFREETGGSSSQDAGRVVRAAINSGWITNLTIEQAAAMKPSQVRWMAQKLDGEYLEAVTIPPE